MVGLFITAYTKFFNLLFIHRAPYVLEEKIQAELDACFIAAFNLFGTQDLHKLETMLLADNTAKDYCVTFMIGLHGEIYVFFFLWKTKRERERDNDIGIIKLSVNLRSINTEIVATDTAVLNAELSLTSLFWMNIKSLLQKLSLLS